MSQRMAAAVAGLVASVKGRTAAAFVLPESRFFKHKRKRDELASRRAIKRLVRPENALGLIEQLPARDEILHAILRGDFVIGDMLAPMFVVHGPCAHLRISTLGMSVKNAETLREFVKNGTVTQITLIVSHYFRGVDKVTTYHACSKILEGFATLKVSRCHAKVICAEMVRGNSFVFEGSANLRSSDTLEQLTVFNDPELLSFHAAWMDAVAPLAP